MKRVFISLILWIHAWCLAQELELPRGLEVVISKRIDQSKIRAIGYNMHITQEIEIQRLKIPGLMLQERRILEKVTVDGRVFDFNQCAAVWYDSLLFEGSYIHFQLGFIPLRDPNDYQLDCKVDVSNNQIGEPECTKTLYKWPEGT